MSWKDHFSQQSEHYAKYRPHYPEELYQYLLSLVTSREVAWDCGTGNGQVAVQLAQVFEKVVATDASASQINHARLLPNIEYRVACAENSGLPAHSVHLITVAQAVHWFDFGKFYEEVHRVSHEAVIAVWGYGLLKISRSLDEPIQHFYSQTLCPYWEQERKHLDQAYRSIPFPFQTFDAPHLTMQCFWNLQDLLGYLSTWSSLQKFIKLEKYSPLEDLAVNLSTLWGSSSSERKKVSWDLYLKVGKV